MTAWRKQLVSIIILGCVLVHSVGGSALAVSQVDRAALHLTVVHTSDGLILEWHTPDAHIIPRADGTVGVAMSGYSQTAQPGAPQVPFTSTLIALPADALPTLQVLSIQENEIPLPGPVVVAPTPQGVQRDKTGHPIGGAFSSSRSSFVSRPSSRQADTPVTLEEAGIVRGVRLARLTFYPVRPTETGLRLTTHLRVSLSFGRSLDTPSSVAPPDPLLTIVRSAVINPAQVSDLTADRRPPAIEIRNQKLAISNPTGAGPATTAVEVSAPGLTAITYQALKNVGFPTENTDPHTLHLTRAGNEVAFEWEGDDDALFESDERLLFYADPRPSRWTPTDVYFLWRSDTSGLRMSNRSAAPTGAPPGIAWADETREINAIYTPDCFCGSLPAGRDGDRWTWDDLRRPNRATGSYPITLPMAVDATQAATLTVWFIGYTDVITANPDHRVETALNNTPLGHIEWNGKQVITATWTITPGLLHGGVNTLTLTLPGLPGVSVEGAWLDAFSIRYARNQASDGSTVILSGAPTTRTYTVTLAGAGPYRVYDITDPLRPEKLTDWHTQGQTVTWSDPPEGGSRRYLVTAPDGITSPRLRLAETLWGFRASGGFRGADMLVITHPDFVSALTPLADLRQAQGLTTTIVNVLGIYDEWGDGRPDPAAIHSFIANAYATWSPRPGYVLLVGDGSFDPKRYRADSPPTLIPPYLADVDPWAGETAADNRYVAVDGEDALPDMLIGRLPVQTLTEAQTIVNKIVQYETHPLPGGWNANVAFVADNADAAGDFAAQSDIIATTYVTLPFTAQRIYFTPPTTTVTATQQATLNMWNAGALIAQFTGHSSWQQWAAERFFHLDDLPLLRHDRRWPIVVEMTCFTGAFQRPEPTLDEELLKLSGGGAVAVWGATGLGVSTGHDRLDDGFFRAVFSDTVSTVGQAALSGKLALAASGQHLDLLDTFTLLGDPALRLNRTIVPWASQVYLPIILK